VESLDLEFDLTEGSLRNIIYMDYIETCMTVKKKRKKPKHLHLISDDEQKSEAAIKEIFRENEHGFRMLGSE